MPSVTFYSRSGQLLQQSPLLWNKVMTLLSQSQYSLQKQRGKKTLLLMPLGFTASPFYKS
jgi:hypothetical protein